MGAFRPLAVLPSRPQDGVGPSPHPHGHALVHDLAFANPDNGELVDQRQRVVGRRKRGQGDRGPRDSGGRASPGVTVRRDLPTDHGRGAVDPSPQPCPSRCDGCTVWQRWWWWWGRGRKRGQVDPGPDAGEGGRGRAGGGARAVDGTVEGAAPRNIDGPARGTFFFFCVCKDVDDRDSFSTSRLRSSEGTLGTLVVAALENCH